MAGVSKDATENPCNMCMPLGGILALKGIENSMVIVHGSQGCSTYMRRHIAEHFNEPIDVASSSLNEKGTIYGGEKNLKQAIDNVRSIYDPAVIGIVTTCLAETIGEDIARVASEYLVEKQTTELSIVTASTPGYGDSHTEGYYLTLRQIVVTLAQAGPKHERINVIVSNVSPADIREIKRILGLLDIEYVFVPDISDTLDRPYGPTYNKMASGGTPIADIRAMGSAKASIQIGITIDENLLPGKYLAETFGVPCYTVPVPIGLDNTDRFIEALCQATGKVIPEAISAERGRLLDAMIDSHKYNFSGRSVIFGDCEMVYAVTALCAENGIFPVVVATGSKAERLDKAVRPLLQNSPHPVEILRETDFQVIRVKSTAAGANVAIGHSDGRYLTEKAGIPLIRLGFPILDRVGGQRLLSVGYVGTAMLLDRITNTLLEHKYKNYRRTMYDSFYTNKNSVQEESDCIHIEGGGNHELSMPKPKHA